MIDKTKVGPALGKIASGLYVTTAVIDGRPVGMLSSFVEQAGFEPPMISIAIGRGRAIGVAMRAGGRFGLNILSKSNGLLVKAFARPDNPDPFAGHPLVENVHGLPQFEEAWAFLACEVRGSIEAGDHILYLAEVVDGILQRDGGEPMIRVRQDGFGY